MEVHLGQLVFIVLLARLKDFRLNCAPLPRQRSRRVALPRGRHRTLVGCRVVIVRSEVTLAVKSRFFFALFAFSWFIASGG